MSNTQSDSMQTGPKRVKLDESDDGEENGTADKGRFGGFSVNRVLNDKPRDKLMIVAGKFEGSDEDAVVFLEKTPFTKDAVSKILTSQTKTVLNLQNDIYSTYLSSPLPSVNEIKTTIIYPATQKHIEKNTTQEVFMLTETPDDYKEITLPFIEASQFSLQWVYNILEKKKEADRIVFEYADDNKGFILLPDMKWDGQQVEDLYLVAIVQRHGLRSIRDLDHSHLPLLNAIKQKATAAIKEKYGLPASKLRLYLHYQPTYYHLHVHITHVNYDAPGSNIGKAVGLQDVINNLTIDTEYYKKASMSFTLGKTTDLCKKYIEAGKL